MSSTKPDIPDEQPDRLPLWRQDGGTLQINEIFYSIEGEGARVGQTTTFVRLARCNLRCRFCDTEFDTYTEMSPSAIAAAVKEHPAKWVCFTGGEPLGQNLYDIAALLTDKGYRLHVETNGVVRPDARLFDLIEHWTVSPKRHPIVDGFERISELKYVVGKSFREERVQEDVAEVVYLQPESSEPQNIEKALKILARHPNWRLSCRIHKVLGLP